MPEKAHMRLVAVATVAPVVAAALALAVAGCGDGGGYDRSGTTRSTRSTTAPVAAAQRVPLKADAGGGLYFEPRRLEAAAGAVTLVMTNPRSTGTEHGIAIRGGGIDRDGPVVRPGGTASVTATLERGSYTFYCDYADHAKRGMKGTLRVE
jgi:plastocyanin